MVGTESLGDQARQAQRPLQGQSRRRAQACGHSAPHVDRRNRVQLVEEGGCRLAGITGLQSSHHTVGKDVPAGTMAMVSSTDFVRASEWTTAIATLNRQRHLTPSCGGLTPAAERTVGPARTIAESLTPRPGIREQNLPKASDARTVRPSIFAVLRLTASSNLVGCSTGISAGATPRSSLTSCHGRRLN